MTSVSTAGKIETVQKKISEISTIAMTDTWLYPTVIDIQDLYTFEKY